MEIQLGNHLTENLSASAVTIGNFDGVHRGHQHILQRLKVEAVARKLRTVVVIFEPQPAEFFASLRHSVPPPRLTPLRDKLRLLHQSGCVDVVKVLRFNQTFSQQSAEQFIAKTIKHELNTQYLLVGDDFRFGKGREGHFEFLQAQTAFVTENTPSILIAGERASSTAVRRLLSEGKLTAAEQILGHSYSLSGRVKHGKKLGRTLGCPTANIHLPAYRYALNGVFVVEVFGQFGKRNGVANLGFNPTTERSLNPKLEVHLFDFNENLYGKRLFIRFLHKLRDEEKFDSVSQMQQQIYLDMDAARDWCASN